MCIYNTCMHIIIRPLVQINFSLYGGLQTHKKDREIELMFSMTKSHVQVGFDQSRAALAPGSRYSWYQSYSIFPYLSIYDTFPYKMTRDEVRNQSSHVLRVICLLDGPAERSLQLRCPGEGPTRWRERESAEPQS